MIPKSKQCPCGNNKTYSSCCGRIHLDQSQAKSPEELMRSRYTAFTLANGDYLNQSHHESVRKAEEKEETEKWAKSVKWMGLDVLEASLIDENSTEGFVEFKAHFKSGLFKKVIHEKSRFRKENGIWFYVDAV